ncbi:MAG: hypothetical protein P8Y71_24395 [Pseudolabrys sp.]
MASDQIKSGVEVVTDFLESLQGDKDIDADTLHAVRELFDAGKLTKTRLQNSLDELRATAIARGGDPGAKDAPGDD